MHPRRYRFHNWTVRLVSLIGFSFISASNFASAEVCGIDLIFADGYQDLTPSPALSSLPQALQSPGITASIDGGALSATITYPLPGATIAATNTQVAGTFSGPTNTGITVNGQIAFTQGGQFVVPNVPLQAGGNTLNLTATKLTGATATANVTVTQSGTDPLLSLIAERDVGYAPQPILFTPTLSPLPSGASVQSVSVDYGDGSPGYTGATFPSPFSHLYRLPGSYSITLSVTDNLSRLYTAQHRIMLQDLNAQRGMLCDVYGYLRQQLVARQIPNALNALQGNVSSRYQPVFTGLGGDLPAAANGLGVIVSGTLMGDTAQFLVARERADHTLAGFPLSFAQSADGVWRITGM